MDRIRPSEAHSAALASTRPAPDKRTLRDAPHTTAHWSSQDARQNRRKAPPAGLDNLVAWCRSEYELELPEALHSSEIWTDRRGAGDEIGYQPVGSSETGALAYAPSVRQRLEGSPHERDRDGSVKTPFASAVASLRKRRPYGHATIYALIVAQFDWRSMVGQFIRYRLISGERLIVRPMDAEVLGVFLEDALRALWFAFTERESAG